MKNTAKTGMNAVLSKLNKRNPVFKRKDDTGKDAGKASGMSVTIAMGKPPAGKADEPDDSGADTAPTLASLASRIDALESRCDAYESEEASEGDD